MSRPGPSATEVILFALADSIGFLNASNWDRVSARSGLRGMLRSERTISGAQCREPVVGRSNRKTDLIQHGHHRESNRRIVIHNQKPWEPDLLAIPHLAPHRSNARAS